MFALQQLTDKKNAARSGQIGGAEFETLDGPSVQVDWRRIKALRVVFHTRGFVEHDRYEPMHIA
jgi:hypothetical protein